MREIPTPLGPFMSWWLEKKMRKGDVLVEAVRDGILEGTEVGVAGI